MYHAGAWGKRDYPAESFQLEKYEMSEKQTLPAVPEYLKAYMAQPNTEADSLASSSISIPRISLRGRKFRLIEGGEGIRPAGRRLVSRARVIRHPLLHTLYLLAPHHAKFTLRLHRRRYVAIVTQKAYPPPFTD